MPEQKVHQEQQTLPDQRREHHQDHRNDQPKAVVVPPNGQQQQHQRHFEHQLGNQPGYAGYPRFAQPQVAYPIYRQYEDPRQFHERRFQNPYGGLNNFWGEDYNNNYYNEPYRRDNDRDNFIPRVIEGILGGILTGTLIKDNQSSDDVEDNDDNGQGEKLERALKEVFSPDKQLQANLDFSPQGQSSGMEARFERTG